MRTKIELLFSDLEVGTREFGFIEREGRDPEEEDRRYEDFVRTKTGDKSVRVVEGTLYYD